MLRDDSEGVDSFFRILDVHSGPGIENPELIWTADVSDYDYFLCVLSILILFFHRFFSKDAL